MTDVSPISVVVVSGTLNAASKTDALLDAIVGEVEASLNVSVHRVTLSAIGPLLAGCLDRASLDLRVERELRQIESAEMLIVGSPVFRASFSGLFKHLFDLIDQHSLVGVPVLLSGTGGSERHGLMLDHSLRPLFGFFEALTLPSGVYATSVDFAEGRLVSKRAKARVVSAVKRAVPFVIASATEARAAAANGPERADQSSEGATP